MLTKEQKISIYTHVRDIFILGKRLRLREINTGVCAELMGLAHIPLSRLPETFPEFYSLKPKEGPFYSGITGTVIENLLDEYDYYLWFAWGDFDSRIETLTKAIAICEAS